MFCAAIPVTAAAGASLDSKQRHQVRVQGRAPSRLCSIPLLTILAIALLLVGSVLFHTQSPWLW
jgi:hypothetical protein